MEAPSTKIFVALSSRGMVAGRGLIMAAGRDLIMAAGRGLIRIERVAGLGQRLTGVGFVVNHQPLPQLTNRDDSSRVIFWERKL